MSKFLRLACRVSIAISVAFSVALLISRNLQDAPAKPKPVELHADDLDQRLQSVAVSALGEREGAIVVLDPQTGRLRTVVNQKLAFQQAFPPGSTIKPFTALAALRNNIIKPDTRISCRVHKRKDVVDSCVHPPDLQPFDPAEALAYSCNYYFATVGEHLDEKSVARLLSEFGFGQKTGVDDAEESAGGLARARWQPESAIGEGTFLQVTPIQLATAYAALLNGGKLFKPTTSFTSQLRAQLSISDDERSILLEGMRGAVTFGTAEKADLDSLPAYVVGKTGTSTPLQGFRTHGWFAGVAFASNTRTDPANAQLLVVVYLRKSHGVEAAEVARAIFEEFSGGGNSTSEITYVSVHQVRENSTEKLPLEDYVVHVVSSEASVEGEPEALKALAIAARTYALKNLGRHKDEGYDFCSTTHCQRFETVTTRPASVSAVKETSGMVLRDEQGQIIDAYFSASCGGMTANIKELWGVNAPSYLRGVRDDYCSSGPHYRWTDVIPADKLMAALRSDPRTDVGQRIRNLSITKYDDSGRAELISISGDRTRAISGWEFKLIAGRSLGWNVLKSSRFKVSRVGSQFVFRGSGFGHGLGLCQEGSHVMARRGHSFQQILAHYYPGTSVREYHNEQSTQRSSHFRLVLPQTVERRDAEHILDLLETNRTELLQRVASAGIEAQFPNLEVVFNETTGDFVGRTGMAPWAAAATKKNKIELQPFKLLKQRRILETTLRHELVHVLIDAIGGGQTPRWLTEGMAIFLAGEGRLLESNRQTSAMSTAMVEQALTAPKSAGEMKSAYAAAYNLVKELIRTEGEKKVWKRIIDQRYISHG